MWWILYGYYVMFMCGGQNSWFCKASLRICYVSLFECKGPWMLKTYKHDFSGKHLCNGYCMDIMWCLREGQNSWFCKASLRICYVSLFECKGPWMLKTVINCHVWNRGLEN